MTMTTITTEKIEELRRLTKAATPGEWAAFIDMRSGTFAVHTPDDERKGNVVGWTGFDGDARSSKKQAAANARHIAAANPAVILALTDIAQNCLQSQEAQHPDDIAVDRFAAAMKEKLKLAREKGRGGWEQCDPADLSDMLRDHVEKGDPRDVANFCMFLWSLGKPIGDARPALDMKLTPLNGIQVWIDAYTNPANGPNFMGHGRIVQLLREYLALRKLLAPRTPPPLPDTHYNGCGDGSEPLYTADMVRLYALQYASQLALPAGPVPEGRTAISLCDEYGSAVTAFTAEEVQAVRHAALEEAAKVCDQSRHTAWSPGLAAAIRALKNSPSPAVAQPVADERFYMSHGMWHDRMTGQHLYTQAEYDAEARACIVQGKQDAMIEMESAGLCPMPVEATEEMLKAVHPLHWWDAPGKKLAEDYKKMVAARAALCQPAEEGDKA